jgi:hypothetical protein
VDHAFISVPNGRPYRPDQASSGEFPYPDRFIRGARNQITVFCIKANPFYPGGMHPGFYAQDWVFGRFSSVGNPALAIREDLAEKG